MRATTVDDFAVTDDFTATKTKADAFTATKTKAKAKGAVGYPSKPVSALYTLRQILSNAAVSPWRWMAITCMLLGISGGLRLWRDLQVAAFARQNKESPFPLSELPKELGNWTMEPGPDGHLSPDVAKIAGASDDFTRFYVHNNTREKVLVLVLHGLARSVYAHTAEVCSPSVGFRAVGPTQDHELTIPGSEKAAYYRMGYYSKNSAGVEEPLEIVYSFCHDGEWLGDASDHWKKFRTHPGMFKVQIERHAGEVPGQTSPSISLLSDLMYEINRRVGQAPKAPVSRTSASEGNPTKS